MENKQTINEQPFPILFQGSVWKALRKVRERDGVYTSHGSRLNKENVYNLLSEFYDNRSKLSNIPRGEFEPKGMSLIGLRDAVVVDIPGTLENRDWHFNQVYENNVTQIVRNSDSEFKRRRDGVIDPDSIDQVSIFFKLSGKGGLYDFTDFTHKLESVKTMLSVNKKGDVINVVFIYPDSLSKSEMQENQTNPYYYQLLMMATIMQYNLENKVNGGQGILPGFKMQNKKFRGGFDPSQHNPKEKSVTRTLWNAVGDTLKRPR